MEDENQTPPRPQAEVEERADDFSGYIKFLSLVAIFAKFVKVVSASVLLPFVTRRLSDDVTDGNEELEDLASNINLLAVVTYPFALLGFMLAFFLLRKLGDTTNGASILFFLTVLAIGDAFTLIMGCLQLFEIQDLQRRNVGAEVEFAGIVNVLIVNITSNVLDPTLWTSMTGIVILCFTILREFTKRSLPELNFHVEKKTVHRKQLGSSISLMLLFKTCRIIAAGIVLTEIEIQDFGDEEKSLKPFALLTILVSVLSIYLASYLVITFKKTSRTFCYFISIWVLSLSELFIIIRGCFELFDFDDNGVVKARAMLIAIVVTSVVDPNFWVALFFALTMSMHFMEVSLPRCDGLLKQFLFIDIRSNIATFISLFVKGLRVISGGILLSATSLEFSNDNSTLLQEAILLEDELQYLGVSTIIITLIEAFAVLFLVFMYTDDSSDLCFLFGILYITVGEGAALALAGTQLVDTLTLDEVDEEGEISLSTVTVVIGCILGTILLDPIFWYSFTVVFASFFYQLKTAIDRCFPSCEGIFGTMFGLDEETMKVIARKDSTAEVDE